MPQQHTNLRKTVNGYWRPDLPLHRIIVETVDNLDESIVSLSGLLYLHKVQLDRSCAAED